jgi:hypothetical protein
MYGFALILRVYLQELSRDTTLVTRDDSHNDEGFVDMVITRRDGGKAAQLGPVRMHIIDGGSTTASAGTLAMVPAGVPHGPATGDAD